MQLRERLWLQLYKSFRCQRSAWESGTASRITLLGRSLMILENTAIVGCVDGKENTVLTARELQANLNEGIRTAKRVKIRVAPPGRHEYGKMTLLNSGFYCK